MSKPPRRIHKPTEREAIANLTPPTLSRTQRFHVIYRPTGRRITTAPLHVITDAHQDVLRAGFSWDDIKIAPTRR